MRHLSGSCRHASVQQGQDCIHENANDIRVFTPPLPCPPSPHQVLCQSCHRPQAQQDLWLQVPSQVLDESCYASCSLFDRSLLLQGHTHVQGNKVMGHCLLAFPQFSLLPRLNVSSNINFKN
ncbi:hypothetical protein DUNSADRAFT_8486 [Dunaliella salina]|uniref:Encoded protein n=1 Tax=Dunaliella salina TaxID=3046 RepID=A0ABQ7GJD1_DUNSA|nr:hypothetical protein DUNSADRAFT_8486 [Dunaliella salina]|eukprot:KAF5834716.1 hypothetical protein DUNSADRAFT_8486 [Dunaliella salina]